MNWKTIYKCPFVSECYGQNEDYGYKRPICFNSFAVADRTDEIVCRIDVDIDLIGNGERLRECLSKYHFINDRSHSPIHAYPRDGRPKEGK